MAESLSTPSFALVHLERLKSLQPDVVLVDYSTNDYYFNAYGGNWVVSGAATKELLKTYEQIARELWQMPSAGLMVSMIKCPPGPEAAASYNLQDDLYRPIADMYGMALVSIRDAVWPTKSIIPAKHIYDSAPVHNTCVHPQWYTAQLVADCIAYAWVAAEKRIDDSPPLLKHDVDAMPSRNFSSTDDMSGNVQPCDSGWMSSLAPSADGADASFRPIEAGPGWTFVDDVKGKEGWQFDAAKGGNGTIFGPLRIFRPITFRMGFGATPRLVVSYLRSYERFGRAAIWFDGDEEQARRVHLMRKCYTYVCEWRYHADAALRLRRGKIVDGKPAVCTPTESGIFSIKWKKPRELVMSPFCSRILSEPDMPMPLGLDGRWRSRSSQKIAAAFSTGWDAGTDLNLMGARVVDFDKKKNLTTPDSHTVSIALVQEVAANPPDPPLFKLMGLNSC